MPLINAPRWTGVLRRLRGRLWAPDPLAGTATQPWPGWARWLYIGAVAVGGTAALASAIRELSAEPVGWNWLILAGLTWAAGMFPLRVSGTAVVMSLSETFVFMIIIAFGGAPAIATVTIDGLMGSLRRDRRLPRVLFNAGEPAITVWLAAWTYQTLSGQPPLAFAPGNAVQLLFPALAMAAVYLLVNTWLIAVAVNADTGASPTAVWRAHAIWLSVNHVGGALLALHLSLDARHPTWASLIPIVPFMAVVYLGFRTWGHHLESINRHLEEIDKRYLATVEGLSMAIDARDQVTHGHIRRVQTYALALARHLGIHDPSQIKALQTASLLHDMGKVAVPDYILNKPGALTALEMERMKSHVLVGTEILSAVNFPYPVVPIVRHHHESWDGSGYPDGLAGEHIPIGARILSVIDCYDALTSDRPYRRAMTSEEALAVIVARRGAMYDPAVVDAFVELLPNLPRVAVPRLEHIVPGAAAPRTADAEAEAASAVVLEGTAATDDVLRLCDHLGVWAQQATPADVLHVVSYHLARLTPATHCAFLRLDEHDGQSLALAELSGPDLGRLAGLRVSLSSHLSGWVYSTGRTMRNADPALDVGGRLDKLTPPVQSALVTPLDHGSSRLGVLALYAPGIQSFTQQHQEIVELVAGPVALALSQAIGNQDESGRAARDPVTGLPNREHLNRMLASPGFVSLAERSTSVLVAEVLDAQDAFRQEQLRRLVRVVKQSVRATDLVLCDGERRLLILLLRCPGEVQAVIGRRIRDGYAEMASREHGMGRVVVASARAPADGDTLVDLIAQADARLQYHRGRSRALGGVEPAGPRPVPGQQGVA